MTLQEIIDEISKRCRSVVIAVAFEGKDQKYLIFTDGLLIECLGLAERAKMNCKEKILMVEDLVSDQEDAKDV